MTVNLFIGLLLGIILMSVIPFGIILMSVTMWDNVLEGHSVGDHCAECHPVGCCSSKGHSVGYNSTEYSLKHSYVMLRVILLCVIQLTAATLLCRE